MMMVWAKGLPVSNKVVKKQKIDFMFRNLGLMQIYKYDTLSLVNANDYKIT